MARRLRRLNMFNFLKKNNSKKDLELKDMVDKGLLTKEEMLRIKKDRAILEWELEIQNRKKKK